MDKEEHQLFWEAWCKVFDVEPPEPENRILGRNYCMISAVSKGNENSALGALNGAMALDTADG